MEQFKMELQNYNLNSILNLISDTTKKMFSNDRPIEEIPYAIKVNSEFQYKKFYIAAWDLTDLSYYAVKYCSNLTLNKPTFEEFIYLISAYKRFEGLKQKQEHSKIETDQDMYLFIITGHSQKQFWYQQSYLMMNNFFRNIQLLQRIANKFEKKINVDQIIQKNLDMTVEDYNRLLFLLYSYCIKNNRFKNIKISKSIIQKIPSLTEKKLQKIIDIYTCSYQEIKESSLNELFFFTKPIIRTSCKELVVSNIFLLEKLLSDGVYWYVRNYCYDKYKNNDFTNQFGYYFEEYANELFEKNLSSNNFKKIQETNKTKLADWHLNTNEFDIIIEQKSALVSLKTKTMYPDLETLKKYLNNFRKAIKQLDKTEEKIQLKNKKVVKFIVYYEVLFVTSILKNYLMKDLNLNNNDYTNLFFVSIEELEILISVLGESEEQFNKMINEKIILEKENSSEKGTDFEIIFKKYGVNQNKYIESLKKDFFSMIL